MKTKLLILALGLAAHANTGGARALPDTVAATIPVEVLAVDPALATGGIPLEAGWTSPRIAMQPVRAARGVVLDKKDDVLLLALLEPVGRTAEGTARLDGPADRIAWCALPRFISNTVACYQDLDSDGKFETSRTGMMGTNEALALSRLQAAKPIEPIAYRAAQPAELPLFQVGIRGCGITLYDDEPLTFDGELRFETAVRRNEGLQWPKAGLCNNVAELLETMPDGGKRFRMGRFKVEVHDEETNELTTRLVAGIPAGTLLAHVRTSWPLTDATERPPDATAISGDTPFLVAVGTPTIAAHARPGEEIFSIEVRHGLTGRLAVASGPRLKRDKVTLPAGTPLYGVAMTSSLTPYYDAEVVWCTPVKQPDSELQPHCFVPNQGSTALIRAYTTAYTARGISTSGLYRNPPIVERGPAEFGGPLMLTIRLENADRKYVNATWSLAPRGQKIDDRLRLRRAKDDAGFILMGDLLLKIAPADDGASFEITPVGQIEAGSPLDLPMDAALAVRR